MAEPVDLSEVMLLQIGISMATAIDDSVLTRAVGVLFWGGLLDDPDEAVRLALRAEFDDA